MQSALDSRYSWFRLAITLLIAMVGNVGMWSIIVVMPAIEAEFGTGRAASSAPYTAVMTGFAAGTLLIGFAVDRWGMARCLLATGALVVAGFVASAYAPTITTLTLLQLVVGFGAAANFGPLIADVSQWFLKRRGIAVAVAASGNYLSGAIWPILLAGVLEASGWRTVYLMLALVTALVVLPLALVLRRKLPDEDSDRAEASAAARRLSVGLSPRALVALLALAGIACCMAMSMPQVHIVSFCVDLGYGPAAGAEMLSLMLLGGVVSRLVSGVLADRIGGVMTLLIGSFLQMVALFLYLPWDGLVSLYVVSLIFGLSQGGIVPSYAVIVREYLPARTAASRVGLVMGSTIIGMALGGWVSGVIYDLTGSYAWAFLNGIGWNALNLGIVLLILSRSRPGRVPAPAS